MNSSGNIFLIKHLKTYGGLEFNEKLLKRLINITLDNSRVTFDDSMLLRSMKRGYEFVEITEKDFKKVDADEIVKRAISMANLHLSEAFNEDIKIYFLYGIRGTVIVLGNEIAIDICDEYVNNNGLIDVDSLVGILAHELHHVAISKHLFNKQKKEENQSIQRLTAFLGDLVSEGLAYYYLPSPCDKDGMISGNWRNNLKNIDEILSQINDYLDNILNGTLVDLKEIEYLFNDNLKGYTAGYEMIRIMDRRYGKEKVFEYIKDCFLFLSKYKQAMGEN